jgi:hypothetical protein
LLADDEAPPGPLEEAAPPLAPVLLDAAPPLPVLLVPPVAPVLLSLEEEPGELGAVAVDEDDEPPGTITVSFSLVTVEVGPGAAPGITTVSLRSHAESANAPTSTNR